MTFLPIVERELRVAARRRSTFVIRCAVALLALVLAGFGAAIAMMNSARLGGKYIFNSVSFYVFVFALLGGPFLAADCLSRERREGTLGFLFLTDLKGYDVVLGKFMAISLNAFYGLLAVLPVLALSLLAGGVTAPEFGRMSLALINALFFSVAVATWISSRSVSWHRATAGSICALVGLITVTQTAHACLGLVPAKFSGFLFYLAASNPAEPFLLASDAGYRYGARMYWSSLAESNLLGWALLGLAAWSLPRLIASREETAIRRLFSKELPPGRSQRRSALVEVNPVLWWLDDSRALRWVAWVLAIAGGILLLTVGRHNPMGRIVNNYVAWPFYFLLKVFFAIQACRFFSEGRRTGSLELIRSTPLTLRDILRGQWLALRQLFLWPVVLLMAAQVVAMLGMSYNLPLPSLLNLYAPLGVTWQIGGEVADFFAVGWFGMWLALNGKKPETAAGFTILFVLVLPIFAFCLPRVAIDLLFIVVARSKLLQELRNPSLILGGKPGY